MSHSASQSAVERSSAPGALSTEETVFLHVRALFQNGMLPPSGKLPSERKLADTLGLSRAAVREALRNLKVFGVVRTLHGSGTYLLETISDYQTLRQLSQTLRRTGLEELMAARKLIEGELAARAACHANEEDLEAIRQCLDLMARTRDADTEAGYATFLRHDFAFHARLAETARNRFLAELLNLTRVYLLENNQALRQSPGQAEEAVRAHKAILEAVRQGDADKARKVMLAHLEQIESTYNSIVL